MNYFNKNKTLSIVVILVLIINLTALITIFVQRHDIGGPRNMSKQDDIERTTQFLKNELQFSDDQIETFLELQDDFLKQNIVYQKAIGDTKFKLYESLRLNEDTEESTDLLIKEIAKSSYLMEKNTYLHFQAIKSLCAEEQIENFDKLMRQIQMRINPEHRPPIDRPGHPDNRQGPPPDGKPGERPMPPPHKKIEN